MTSTLAWSLVAAALAIIAYAGVAKDQGQRQGVAAGLFVFLLLMGLGLLVINWIGG